MMELVLSGITMILIYIVLRITVGWLIEVLQGKWYR